VLQLPNNPVSCLATLLRCISAAGAAAAAAAAAAAVLWPGLCLEYWWRTCVVGPKPRDWIAEKMSEQRKTIKQDQAAAAAAAAEVRRKESTGSESSQKKLL
jgi:hypothetical protein